VQAQEVRAAGLRLCSRRVLALTVYRNRIVGKEFVADLAIADAVVVDVKVNEVRRLRMPAMHEFLNATGLHVSVLNFGRLRCATHRLAQEL
jgi:hypothetical protein